MSPVGRRGAQRTPNGRFRPEADLFAARLENEVHVAEVRCGPERSVDLFHELCGAMPQVVDFALGCLRTGRRYLGESLQLPEITETVARLKVPLVASGGVELAVYTADDQLALSPTLDLWIFARSGQWIDRLLDLGLEETDLLPPRAWTVAPGEFHGAPELVEAVTRTAERLTLRLLP